MSEHRPRRASRGRREFLQMMALGGSWVVGASMGFAKTRKLPNVILILTDDQGSIDVNCYGSTDLYTPHLDSLAKRGVRFDQFYVGAPICSPSRATLLTGRYPQRAQLDTNAWGKLGMPSAQVTLAEAFKVHGYRTGIFGKWHLGIAPDMSPLAQGFDAFFGHKEGCIDNYSHYFYWFGPNRHDLWRNDEVCWEEGQFFPDLIVREAHRFLEENREKPFFMYLPFNVPHYPLQGQAVYRDRYKDLAEPRRAYAAFVSTLDEKIGQVIDKVDALGLREDTIIVLLSDNGHSVEQRAFGGGGSAGPYRGHKDTLWEGGIRVPCIVSWPGQIPEDETRDQMVASMDWFPTILKYCGIKKVKHRIDGEDISRVIADRDAPSPHEVLHWQQNQHWAVREGPWKLVANGPATQTENGELPEADLFLSNLEEDVTETVNLAAAHPDKVAHLKSLHRAWASTVREQ